MAKMPTEPRKTTETSTALVLTAPLSVDLGATIQRLREMGKLERRTLPPLVRPGDMPVGSELLAKLIRVVDSMAKDIEGKLLWLQNREGTEFLFPITGQIGQALQHPDQEIGKWILLKRNPDETSAKYKKPMFAFEVWTISEADLDVAS